MTTSTRNVLASLGATLVALGGVAACAFGHGDSDGEVAFDDEIPARDERAITPPARADERSDAVPTPEPEPAAVEADEALIAATEVPSAAPGNEELGEFDLTYYWIATESADAEPSETLYGLDCKPLAKVSATFARQLAMEGTGRLKNGATINAAGYCRCPASPCYAITGARWGVGVQKRPLAPFRSVAVDPDHVAIGSLLYIPELDGLTMPGRGRWGGFVHDGCVVAEDRGGGVEDSQIDLFMGHFSYYAAFFTRHRITSITVFDGSARCEERSGRVSAVHRNSI